MVGLLSELGEALEQLDNKVNPLLNKVCALEIPLSTGQSLIAIMLFKPEAAVEDTCLAASWRSRQMPNFIYIVKSKCTF